MMKRALATLIGVFVGLSLAAMSCAPAGEVKPADFYKGSTIDFTLPSEGDLVDTTGRLVASYLQKYTGATSVVTVRRGAGGAEAAMWVYRAKPDGLTIGTWSMLPLVFNKINEAPGADYEIENFSYLFGYGAGPQAFFVAAKGRYQSIAELQAGRNLKIAGTSARGNISLGGMSVAHLLDLDAKVVTGYKAPAAAVLSIQQGETVGYSYILAPGMVFVTTGQVKPLFVLGTKRFPAFPDVPALTELVTLKDEKKAEIEIWQKFSQRYIYFTTIGAPKDRVKFLRGIGDKIIADPELRNEIDKLMGFKVEHLSGEEVSKAIKDVAKEATNAKALFKMLVERYAVIQ